jgi:hypothetical protein
VTSPIVSGRVVGAVGEHRRDRLGHAVELAGPAAEPLAEVFVLIGGEVLREPAVPQPQRRTVGIGRAAAGEDHPHRGGEQAGVGGSVAGRLGTNPLAENVCIRATDAPTTIAEANE